MRFALARSVFVIATFFLLFSLSFSNISAKECREVEWESAEYQSLVAKGWGPVVFFSVAPPPGTKFRLCEGDGHPPASPPPSTPSPAPAPGGLSDDPCPGKGHLSTGEGEDTGITKGVKICDDDGGKKIIQGGCDYNPYEKLEKEFKGNKNAQVTPRYVGGEPVGGIDPALACRLTKFFEVARDKGCNPKVISAYRSPEQQRGMCGDEGGSGCARPGNSCHQYGLAIDVANSCKGWMRKVAPEFKLVYPYYGEHIQCLEHPKANRSSCNRPCDGGVQINPDPSRLPDPRSVPDDYWAPPPQYSAPPSRGLSDQFRNALGMPTQPTQPTIPQTTSLAQPQTQPGTQSLPQPTQSNFCLPEYRCNGKTLVYQNSFCAIKTEQVCSKGCVDGKCVAATSTSATSTSSGGSNGGGSEEEEGKKSSTSTAIDILEKLAGYSATVVDIGTSTPLQLILALGESTGATSSTILSTTRPAPFATGSIYSTQLIGAQQTFTSSDLRDSYPSQNAPPQQNRSALFATLENLRKILLWMLEYLRPFRISQERAEVEHEHYVTE